MHPVANLGPYALVASGVVLFGTGGLWPSLPGPVWVRWVTLAVGVGLFFAGAFWLGRRQNRIESRTGVALWILGVGQFVPMTGAMGSFGLGTNARLVMALVWIGIVAILGYCRFFRTLQLERDERQRRIRLRAVYNGFLVLCGVLFVIGVVSFALGPPTAGRPDAASPVGLGAMALIYVSGFVVLLSEGWYRAQM